VGESYLALCSGSTVQDADILCCNK